MELLIIRLLEHTSRKLNMDTDLFILDFIAKETLSVRELAFLVLQVKNTKDIKLVVPEVADAKNEEEIPVEQEKTITQGLALSSHYR
jgi:hypothetical protein